VTGKKVSLPSLFFHTEFDAAATARTGMWREPRILLRIEGYGGLKKLALDLPK